VTRAGLHAALFLSALPAGAHGGSACDAAVSLQGEVQAVTSLQEELSRRGLQRSPPWNCEPVRVDVDRDEQGSWNLRIRGTGATVAERSANSTAIAGAIVESWARPDVDAALLSPPPTLIAAAAPSVARPAAVTRPIAFSAQGEVTVGPQQVGYGAYLSGSVGVRGLRLGAAVRYEAMPSINSSAPTQWQGLDGLFTAALPLQRWGWVFTPTVGAGAGWLATSVPTGGAIACSFSCGATDAPPFEDDTVQPRAELSLSASRLLGHQLSIDARVAMTFAPWAHSAAFVSSPLAPSTGLVEGEPLWLARMGVGLEWGRP
jgi:hypothetical protein